MTPNMNLVLPVPNVTVGPEWSVALNAALDLVDSHDHTSGKGAPVPISAIDVNTDLNMSGRNIGGVRASRLQNQAAPIASSGLDQRCTYSSGGELYYNDAEGNQVRITNNGSVDVSATGAFQDLSAPASAIYIPSQGKFQFDKDTNERASGAFSSVSLSAGTASANSVTLATPASVSIPSSYTVTMPPAPPAIGTRLLGINSTGALSVTTIDPVNFGTTLQNELVNAFTLTTTSFQIIQSIASVTPGVYMVCWEGVASADAIVISAGSNSSRIRTRLSTSGGSAVRVGGDSNFAFVSLSISQGTILGLTAAFPFTRTAVLTVTSTTTIRAEAQRDAGSTTGSVAAGARLFMVRIA